MRYLIATLLLATPALAEAPDIVDVTATQGADGWRFDVTIAHPDADWDHYADGWRVELADGTELGIRVLAHPHVAEQPFTRSLSGVAIPKGIGQVFVRSRCNVDGWSEGRTVVDLR